MKPDWMVRTVVCQVWFLANMVLGKLVTTTPLKVHCAVEGALSGMCTVWCAYQWWEANRK